MSCGLPGRADSLGPQHRTRTGAVMEIRYSKVCDAAWGRMWHTKVGDAIEILAPSSQPRRAIVRNPADTGIYRFTPMVGRPDRTNLRLCLIPAGSMGHGSASAPDSFFPGPSAPPWPPRYQQPRPQRPPDPCMDTAAFTSMPVSSQNAGARRARICCAAMMAAPSGLPGARRAPRGSRRYHLAGLPRRLEGRSVQLDAGETMCGGRRQQQ
ncbi:DUF2690 domain-containing protein [Streptomyces sp. LZ34]